MFDTIKFGDLSVDQWNQLLKSDSNKKSLDTNACGTNEITAPSNNENTQDSETTAKHRSVDSQSTSSKPMSWASVASKNINASNAHNPNIRISTRDTTGRFGNHPESFTPNHVDQLSESLQSIEASAIDSSPIKVKDEESALQHLRRILFISYESEPGIHQSRQNVLIPPKLLPRGIANHGNTCFINAVLQALIACDPFRALLYALEPHSASFLKANCVLLERFVRLGWELREALATSQQPLLANDSENDSPAKIKPKNNAVLNEITTPKVSQTNTNTFANLDTNVVGDLSGEIQQEKGTAKKKSTANGQKSNGKRVKTKTLIQKPPFAYTSSHWLNREALQPGFIYEGFPHHGREGLKHNAFAELLSKGSQEDAQEFLNCALDELHEEALLLQKIVKELEEKEKGKINSHSSKNLNHASERDDNTWEEIGKKGRSVLVHAAHYEQSCITSIFGGVLRSELKRPGVKSSVMKEPFMCLQLDIENSLVKGLDDALRLYFEPESLEGYRLETSKETVEVKKHFTIEKSPKVLMLHMKRFSFCLETRSFAKVFKHCAFPETLYLQPQFMASSKTSKDERTYHLCAVVTHIGREMAGGHYTCDVLRSYLDDNNQEKTEWVHCDDSKVSPVSSNAVLQRPAYLLFYVRKA